MESSDKLILHHAILKRDFDEIKCILNSDCDLEARKNGFTALHIACGGRFDEIAKLLMDSGADVNATRDGKTCLHLAAAAGSEEMVQLLLGRKVPINARDRNGQTALHSACKSPSTRNHGVVELLVRNGADIAVHDTSGMTALHYAGGKGRKKTAELLWDCQADVNQTAPCGRMPLHYACERHSPAVAACLLKRGAPVNAALQEDGNQGCTPLQIVAWDLAFRQPLASLMDLLELLLDWGADVNAKDATGRTPLMVYLDAFGDYWVDDERAVVEVFTKHLMKLQARNQIVDQANLSAIAAHEESWNFSRACKEELDRMRRTIGDSSVSFFDILAMKSLPRLADYVANESVAKVSVSGDFELEFPIYASEIRKQFTQGTERLHLLRKSDSVLRMSDLNCVPYVFIKKLNGYLANDEFRNIVLAKP